MKKVIFIAIGISLIMSNFSYAGWKQDNGKWWYQNADGGYTVNGWQSINDEYYYFDSAGYMLSDTKTPDGYYVNSDGKWEQRGTIEKNDALADFKAGYENGDHDLLNQSVSSDKYDGKAYWIEGYIKEISSLDNTGKSYYSILTDTDNKEWHLLIDSESYMSKDNYTQFIGHNLCIDGLYYGYAAKLNMPCMIATKIYDMQTGASIDCKLITHAINYRNKIPGKGNVENVDSNTNSNNKNVNVQNAKRYTVGEDTDTEYDKKSSSAKSGYERIYNTYKKKIQNCDGDMEELAELYNAGLEKMVEHMLSNNGKYSTYNSWAQKLYEVYMEKASNAF